MKQANYINGLQQGRDRFLLILTTFCLSLYSNSLEKNGVFALPHTLFFSDPDIFATKFRRPLIFQTLNSNSLKIKISKDYSDCKEIRTRKFESVAKTQFLYVFYVLVFFSNKIKEKFFLKEPKKKENYTN